jgi:uncharacterized membrane protein YfhO
LIQTNLAYFKPWNYLDYNLDILSSTQNLHPLVKDKIPEYLPAWMPSFPSASSASPLEQSATRVSGTHTQESPGVIVLDVAYMPHWKLWIDGQPALVVPSEEGLVQTSAEFPVGEYPVILTWHRTPVENISLVITSVTLLLMIGFILWPKN